MAAFTIENLEFALLDTIAKPVEASREGFRAFAFDGVVSNTGGAKIVSKNGGWGLRPAEVH